RLRNNQAKLKHIQKLLSRKKKNSNRFKKLKMRLAKIYRKETRRRNWLLHNISTYLTNNYDTIITENLNISGMMKNHKFAGSIADASWYQLIKQIDAKCY